jgi:hypothetical protein
MKGVEIRRTKCWTEAPDGPFRNGSLVGGGSVNIAVGHQTISSAADESRIVASAWNAVSRCLVINVPPSTPQSTKLASEENNDVRQKRRN